MDTLVIAVGDELLSGRTVNTNAAHVGRVLAPIGAPVSETIVVPDRIPRIAAAISQALPKFDVVILMGGLGPTHDDVTLAAVARATDLELLEDAGLLQSIEERYRRLDRAIPPGVHSMAQIPRGARILPNEWGTAPGLHLDVSGTALFVLPGVPREMRGILEASVRPAIESMSNRTPVHERSLLTAGVPESRLSEMITDLIPGADDPVRLAFLPGYSGVELRLTTTTDSDGLDRLAGRIRERLGPAFVSDRRDDDLPARIAELLEAGDHTLATAESCTGGLAGKLITDRAGSSRYYLGGVIAYSNELKEHLLGVPAATLEEHGAVSAATALAMAQGARDRLGASFGLAITGIAGPGGGTEQKPVGLIYLGLAGQGLETTRELRLSTDREQNRTRSAYAALDLLRRRLEAKKNPE